VRNSRQFGAILLVASVVGCDTGGWSWDEVARVRSPDGSRDAVLVERNGGATTSFGYEVFVVPHDAGVAEGTPGTVASLYAATRNGQAYGAKLRWLAGDSLAVEYLRAREALIHEQALVRREDRLRVVLRAGVEDASAPSGGMQYNLEHPGSDRPNGR
jgi:hypothetical protein